MNTPLRPRNGIHEIIRMMFDVQNGTVQSRNNPIFKVKLLTWKTRKYATVKPMTSVTAQTITTYLIAVR